MLLPSSLRRPAKRKGDQYRTTTAFLDTPSGIAAESAARRDRLPCILATLICSQNS